MSIETAADRAVFVAAADFGALATYTAAGGGVVSGIAGIFSRPSIEIAIGGLGSLDAKPTFFCTEADLPAAAAGGDVDTLLVAGEGTFKVTALKPDGTGMVLIVLGRSV